MSTRLLCALLVLAISPAALAQVEEGELEISFSSDLFWGEETTRRDDHLLGETEAWGMFARTRVGYFVTRRIDVGGHLGLDYTDFKGDAKAYGVNLGPDVNFHFRPESRVVPLVGAGVGLSYSKSESGRTEITYEGWYVEARGGADVFVNDHVSIRFQLLYQRAEEDVEQDVSRRFFSPIEMEVTSDTFAFLVGFAIFLDPQDP